MAFSKTATALIQTVDVSIEKWRNIRLANSKQSAGYVDASILKFAEYKPEDYLFTHATIVASVSVEDHCDWLITPDTAQFINDNGDGWTRDVLRASYSTFRGAENYLEHIQIPSLSKGKILDAAIRNVGTNDYVDILVATNRIHADLIEEIESQKLNTLSMGAHVAFTVCSKCGNRAPDEVSLCQHIKYEKGNTWLDNMGRERIVAELCGHKDTPDSNVFIEASWVKNPAFSGAVARNIINVTGPVIVEDLRSPVHLHANKAASFGKSTDDEDGERGFLDDPALIKKKQKKYDKKQQQGLATRDNENLIQASRERLLNSVVKVANKTGWKVAFDIFSSDLTLEALCSEDRKKGDLRLSRRAYLALSKCLDKLSSAEFTPLEDILGRQLTNSEKERVTEVINLL